MGIAMISSWTPAMLRALDHPARGRSPGRRSRCCRRSSPTAAGRPASPRRPARGRPGRRWSRSGMPSTSTSPLVGSSSPSMIFSSVVLPPPDGPMMVTNCPASTFRLTFSSTKRLGLGVAEATGCAARFAPDRPRVRQRASCPARAALSAMSESRSRCRSSMRNSSAFSTSGDALSVNAACRP